MKVTLGSSMFRLSQPCTYWRNNDYLDERAKEYHEYLRNERIIDNPKQKYFKFPGGYKYEKGTRRCNLPKDHPQYVKDGEWHVCSEKYLKQVLAPAWMTTFKNKVKEKLTDNGILVNVKFCDTHSPKYYNYGGDTITFEVTLSQRNLAKMIRRVRKESDRFEQFLTKFWNHSPHTMPAFTSSMPLSMKAWEEQYAEGIQSCAFDRAISTLIEYCVFYDDYIDTTRYDYYKNPHFGIVFEREISELEESLGYQEYMYFEPYEEENEYENTSIQYSTVA